MFTCSRFRAAMGLAPHSTKHITSKQ